MNLSEIQSIVFIEYRNNGYLEMWDYPTIHNERLQSQMIFDIAELGLITTEKVEAIEFVRNNKIEVCNNFSDLAKECSDIIIRTLNFMSRKGFDAEKVILHKNKININRGKLHGKE